MGETLTFALSEPMESVELKKQEISGILQALKNGNNDDLVRKAEQLLDQLAGAVSGINTHSSELAELNAAINETALMAFTNVYGQILEVNRSFETKTGYSAEELSGKSMDIFDAGKHTPEFYGHLWNTISSGEIWRGEVAKKTRAGEVLWLKTCIVPMKDDQGNVRRFISLYIDITNRKRIEEELALFLSLLNFTTDAVQVANVAGRFIYVNHKAAENLKYAKEELLKMHVWEVENVFKNLQDWQQHIEEVKQHPGGHLVEGFHKRKDGTYFPVEVNVRYLEQGNDAYLIAVVRDITERKLNASVMENARQQLRQAQEIARVCSYETDIRNNNATTWSANAAAIFGIKPSEFSSEFLMKYMHPDDKKALVDGFMEISKTAGKFEMEYRLQLPDGTVQYIHCINYSQRDEQGEITGFVGTVQNITASVIVRNQLKEYNTELEKRNRELDKFAQIVSHDLKAPLRAIHNISDWIREENPGLGEETDKKIGLLQKRVERMEDLIKGLLNYSGAGRVKDSPVLFSTEKSIKEIAASFSFQDKVRFTFGRLPEITEHKQVFEQVLTHLVSNAIRHNLKDNKEVHVFSEETENGVFFRVQDNGPGIRDDYHEKIFLIFQTLLPRDKMENTGVGLAIVKKLCDDRKWDISLTSNTGKGSCFSLFIPLNK